MLVIDVRRRLSVNFVKRTESGFAANQISTEKT